MSNGCILVLQATANLVPINAKRVAVKFDSFKIAGVVGKDCQFNPYAEFYPISFLVTIFLDTQIPINARGSGRGQIEITYLDEDLR